jgi:antitoxin component YwqK of YwqJK toxin-antitoxin module
LTLTDLTILCNKKNWEDVNQTLLSKNWEYYDSEKGNTYNYNTIIWSYNKDYYNDEAQGWFYLFTYEGLPNKVSYTTFNKEAYSLIQNSISVAGFKLIDSEIEDSEVISTYANLNYTLTISTEKRNDSEWDDNSITAYIITLIKKSGVYDEDNGKKTEYYYGNLIESEYTLLNGKLNGQLKTYYQNGQIKTIENYTNGIENGSFKEYNENGNLETEFTMSNGTLNGLFKAYHSNGKLMKTGSYIDGEEHGNFIEYDEFGKVGIEYTMSNGILNGPIKAYHSNGKLRKTGSFLNGDEYGNFIEYDVDGIINAEYELAYGKKNGVTKLFNEGKISTTTSYVDDIKNGPYVDYYYNDETGALELKIVGEYANDEKNGVWKVFLIEEGVERLITFENYSKGKLNGAFQEYKGDSLIIGSYKNELLHGEYIVYFNFIRNLLGGTIKTDTSELTLLCEGSYFEGLESGYWTNYDFLGTKINEGRYLNGKKTGEWKYYYTKYVDEEGNQMPYARQLYLVENYSNGKLNGKSTRYSFLEEEEFPCSEVYENKSSLDTCKNFVFTKVLETSFYKDDKRHGAFELLDSTMTVMAKGYFKDDLKDSEWLIRYSEKDINEETYFRYQKGNYLSDKREGQWIQYYSEGEITQTFNYKNDEFHGEFIEWNQFNKPREKKQFSFGKLTELITYDSLGVNPKDKYEIYDVIPNRYKCRHTHYFESGYVSQEYWVKKEEEINHNFFEAIFVLTVANHLDGTTAYKEGDYKLFNNNNQLIVLGKQYKEDRVGLWTFYYYDQNVKIESNYTKNVRMDEKYLTLNGELFTGEFTYIDDEKGVKEERKIKEGLRNGKTTYIDLETNKTINKENYINGEIK